MRTTLNLDEDVLDQARALAEETGKPFKSIVNESLRTGLNQTKKANKKNPYKTIPHKMGLRPGYSLDHIQELLSTLEGEDAR